MEQFRDCVGTVDLLMSYGGLLGPRVGKLQAGLSSDELPTRRDEL